MLHRALVAAFLGQLPSDSRGDSPQLTLPLHRVRRFAQRCSLIGAATTLHTQLQQQQQQQQPLAQSHGDSPVHIRSMPVAEFDLVARECLAAAAAASSSSGSGGSSSGSELSLQLFCELLLKLALRRCSYTAISNSITTAANSASSISALTPALYLLSVLEGAASERVTADVTARNIPDNAR
jgi:hypothetical protein